MMKRIKDSLEGDEKIKGNKWNDQFMGDSHEEMKESRKKRGERA